MPILAWIFAIIAAVCGCIAFVSLDFSDPAVIFTIGAIEFGALAYFVTKDAPKNR